MQTVLGIRVCPFHQAIRRSLSIQVMAVRFMRRQIMFDFMVSLNHDFISWMAASLSLILRIRSFGSYD